MGRGSGEGKASGATLAGAPGAAATSAARRHPERNEDSHLVSAEHGLIAVFDGIGGAEGGDVASCTAAEVIAARLDRLPGEDDFRGRRDWLRDALHEAARAVRWIKRSAGQGTTACIALRCGDVALVASVGDSRAYRLDAEGKLHQLTRDDDAYSNGPAEEEARELCDRAEHPDDLKTELATRMFMTRNHLGADLGTLDLHDASVIDGTPVEAGDMLICTSDGVHDNLAQGEIERVANQARRAGAAGVANALRAAARQRADDEDHFRAKDDDITAVALEID